MHARDALPAVPNPLATNAMGTTSASEQEERLKRLLYVAGQLGTTSDCATAYTHTGNNDTTTTTDNNNNERAVGRGRSA